MRLFNFTKATNLKLSRRELLTGVAAVSAASVLPALPAVSDGAVYIKADPSLAAMGWNGRYTPMPTDTIWNLKWFGVAGESGEAQGVLEGDRDYVFVANYDERLKRIVGIEAVEGRPSTVIHKNYADA